MVKFIAEIGSNHSGDRYLAATLIRTCQGAGFDAVKFQFLDVAAMWDKAVIEKRPELRGRMKYNFDPDWLREIKQLCLDYGLEFGLSVYTSAQRDQAVEWVDFVKISSYDLLHCSDLLTDKCPVYLSTGMANMFEIENALTSLQAIQNNLTLMHCVSEYPCLPDNANLAAIRTLFETFDLPVGYSDHTAIDGVIQRAVHYWKACAIEMHVDLDDLQGGEQGAHVWTLSRAQMTINNVRLGLKADGDGRKWPTTAELKEREQRADPEDGRRPLRRAR